jgi:hypothetical protein
MCSFFSQDIQIKLCALDSLFEQRNFDAALVLVNDIIGSAQPMCNYPFAEITLLEYWLGICKQDFIRCQLEDKIMQLLVELESYFDATNFEGNTEIVTICSDLETCLDDYKSKKGSPQRWADFDARMRAAKDFLKTKGFIFWADYV